jgi:CheY-like chemotaxis protein
MILVLDDEAIVREALGLAIGEDGGQALLCETVDEAMTVLAARESLQQPVDLIILDYNLRHGETGADLILAIERQGQRLPPVILVTGATDPETLIALARMRRPWLTKPVAFERLKQDMLKLLSPVPALPATGEPSSGKAPVT